jgi:hypothetical protein
MTAPDTTPSCVDGEGVTIQNKFGLNGIHFSYRNWRIGWNRKTAGTSFLTEKAFCLGFLQKFKAD